MQRQLYLALALATAGLLGATSTASAQKPAPPAPAARADSSMRKTDPAGRLLQQRATLQLTDDQVKKLEQIQTKYAGATRADSSANLSRARRREAWKEATAVLTPAQRDKLHTAWRAKADSMHRERHGAMLHAPGDSAKPAK